MDNSNINKYVLCIYQSGSMNKAAKILGVSQPALSMMVGNLEKKLGYAIFDRKTKPISLTAEGEIYLEYLVQQSILLDDLRRRMDELHGKKNEKLTIGGSVAYVEAMIAPVVNRIRERYPDCLITIKSAPVQELLQETREGKMDCFISASKEVPENFQAIPLKKERIYLGIPKSWAINASLKEWQVKLGEQKEEIDYTLLNGLPAISLLKTLPLQKKMDAFWRERHVVIKENMFVDQVSTGISMAFREVGMIAASEEALQNTAQEEYLCLYSLPEQVSDQTLYMMIDSQRYTPKICRDVLTMLQEEIATVRLESD